MRRYQPTTIIKTGTLGGKPYRVCRKPNGESHVTLKDGDTACRTRQSITICRDGLVTTRVRKHVVRVVRGRYEVKEL